MKAQKPGMSTGRAKDKNSGYRQRSHRLRCMRLLLHSVYVDHSQSIYKRAIGHGWARKEVLEVIITEVELKELKRKRAPVADHIRNETRR